MNIELELEELKSRVKVLEEEVRQSKLSNVDLLEELVKDWLKRNWGVYQYGLSFDRREERVNCPEEHDYSTTLTFYLTYSTTKKDQLSTQDIWKIEEKLRESISAAYPKHRDYLSWFVQIEQVNRLGKKL